MLEHAGALVDDIGAWIAIGVGLTIILGGVYGFAKWMRRLFEGVIVDKVQPMLEHIHDCVERIGGEAVAEAKKAGDIAEGIRATVESHTAQDLISFGEIADWRAKVDGDLRNIQQAQTPYTEG